MKTNAINSSNNLVNSSFTPLTTVVTVSGNISATDTIPQITDGTQILSTTYTAKNVNNLLEFRFFTNYSESSNPYGELITFALFSSSSSNALAATCVARPFSNCVYLSYFMTAGSTSAITYQIRAGLTTGSSGTLYVNADEIGTELFNGASNTMLTIFEYSM